MIRVLIVDDEQLIRSGLRLILEAAGDITVVGEAADGAAARAEVRRLRPDVVLLDVRMPGMDGLAAAPDIVAAGARVIMLTTFDRDAYVHHALRAGAVGFLLKDTAPADLTAAVRAVASGDAMLAPAVTRRLIDSFAERGPSRRHTARRQLQCLTARELEIARAVGRGCANAQIARQLLMSEATVKGHVSRAMTKVGAGNRVQLAILVHDAELP
ncbi:response regulator [Micromonospora sediminimaris]|uniref:DNA-binding response regulator n=1 Tax=Micromonospora sediminimaris TaxID=547162 RepID=A0A9W5UT93_9ACTN|nr:response regulator transcription factor [Micromonospora sediminimaris]GIJ33988.1 DNA-binding response regulator [Micromonospora sediminimaris]SFC75642.1 DNA-binding response regulator, NarL/FixJ family, contains REC and HTH domains [Micromonospora sediminimaris]